MSERLNSLDAEIIAILTENDGHAMMHHILSRIEEDKALAELRITRLARLGILAMVKEKKDYSLHLSRDAGTIVCQANPDENGGQDQSVEVVATIPFSMHRGRAPADGVLSIEEAFGFLLKKATRNVKMCLPFPEESIITHYASQIKGLAARKVPLQILTREIELMLTSGNPKYISLCKALVRLYDIYKSCGNSQLLEVRDYHRSLATRSSPFHYESTHAKIVSVDSSNAYVGSGEFRVNSLYNNFELGVLISGQSVQQVDYIFNVVWDYATPYSLKQIQDSPQGLRPKNARKMMKKCQS